MDELLTRDKTSLDITWIKQTDESLDRPLSEMIADIKAKSENIYNAVAELEKLLANIEDE